jgi:hypothetical protein
VLLASTVNQKNGNIYHDRQSGVVGKGIKIDMGMLAQLHPFTNSCCIQQLMPYFHKGLATASWKITNPVSLRTSVATQLNLLSTMDITFYGLTKSASIKRTR